MLMLLGESRAFGRGTFFKMKRNNKKKHVFPFLFHVFLFELRVSARAPVRVCDFLGETQVYWMKMLCDENTSYTHK